MISVVTPPSLRFQGSLLLEVALFYSIALLYQPMLDRHGTWLIGYRSREAIQFSRNKKEQWYTAPLKRCIIALCNLFRCNIVRWSLKDAVRPGMSFDSYIIPQSNICVNSETQNIVFIFGYFLLKSQYVVFLFVCDRRYVAPPIHPLKKSYSRKIVITEVLNLSEWFSNKVAYKKNIEKVSRNCFIILQFFSY